MLVYWKVYPKNQHRVGGWTNPLDKYAIISPGKGKRTKIFETTS